MADLKSIAHDLGVSTATVSNALSGKGRVSEALANRIRDYAASKGYAPSLAARALKTGRSNILGLVMPDLTNPLFPRLAQGIEAEADACGYGVLIADSHGDAAAQSAAVDRLARRGVDAIVIVPHRGTRISENEVPLAVINTVSDPNNTVSADHAQGGGLAASEMLRLGHREIVLVGGDSRSEVQRDRIAGMRARLEMETITPRTHWVSDGPLDTGALATTGVTAVLTTSDLVALHVMSDALSRGLSVPDQLSVIGFDDLPLAQHLSPPLTSIAPDVREIARRAIAFLDARLAGRENLPRGSTVPMTLVRRGSTGTPTARP